MAGCLPPWTPTTPQDTPEDLLSGRLQTPGWRGRYFCRDRRGGEVIRYRNSSGGVCAGVSGWGDLLGGPIRIQMWHAFGQAKFHLGLRAFPGLGDSELVSYGRPPVAWDSRPEGWWLEVKNAGSPRQAGEGGGRVTRGHSSAPGSRLASATSS